MKIAFHIARLNWYRILAAPIAEALRRGWEVQCWHALDNKGLLKKNAPSVERMPRFEGGKINVLEYDGIDGLRSLIRGSDADLIVDAETIPVALPDLCAEMPGKTPLTVLVDAVSNPRLQNGGRKDFPRFDLFSVPSTHHLESTIALMSRDHLAAIRQVEKELDGWGDLLLERLRESYSYQWSADDCAYYRNNSSLVGVPSLDDLALCDSIAIKKNWGIPSDKKVVGYFPSPYDMPQGYIWGEINYARNILGVLVSMFRHRKLQHMVNLLKTRRDKHIVRAVRRLCDRNNAVFVAKARHSRSAPSYLEKMADVIVGEDGYYPHTALELCAVSDVTIGFTTSAALESIAAGTPYIDIELPYFPKKLYIQFSTPALSVANEFPGAVHSITADDFVDSYSMKSLAEFKLNDQSREKYLGQFASGCVGNASKRLMDEIEKLVIRRCCPLQ